MKYDLANRLSEQLEEQNLSKRTLAQRIDVSSTIVSYWTKGLKCPSAKNIYEIALCLNVSADYLLGLTDIDTPARERTELETPLPRTVATESGGEPSEPRKQRNASTAPAASDAPEEEEDTSPRVRLRYAARGEGNLYADTTEKKLRKLLEELHKNEINPEDDGI